MNRCLFVDYSSDVIDTYQIEVRDECLDGWSYLDAQIIKRQLYMLVDIKEEPWRQVPIDGTV